MRLKNLVVSQLAVAMALSFTSSVYAVGNGTIVNGSGAISHKEGNTVVNQNTDKMIVNWDNMNVGKNESLQFVQPDKNAAVLNRINSLDPTVIQGALNANGKVFVVNPNGVLISNGATVNVGSLIASSLDVKDADFMKSGDLNFTGTGKGDVINEGKITTSDSAVLMGAGKVSNQGNGDITAKGGATLASGGDITLSFPSMGKINVKLNKGSLTALVNNGGLIATPRGSIALTAWATDLLTRSVINNTGTLAADTILSKKEGIYLGSLGNGNIDLAGGIGANHIIAEAKNINVKDGALISNKFDTKLTAKASDGYVQFDKATISGDLQVNADNILTGAGDHQPMFTKGTVTLNSGAKTIAVGKSLKSTAQIEAGKGVISDGIVNAVARLNRNLVINAKQGQQVEIGNATVNYGDMHVNAEGDVNFKSAVNGHSLTVSSEQSINQDKNADINMTGDVMLLAGKNYNQNGNISSNGDILVNADNSIIQNGSLKASKSVYVQSDNSIFQSITGKSTAQSVTYDSQNGSVTIGGAVTSDLFTAMAHIFVKGDTSSIHSASTELQGGDFSLAPGNDFLGVTNANVNFLKWDSRSDIHMGDNSNILNELNVETTGDFTFGKINVEGTTRIKANNIYSNGEYGWGNVALYGRDDVHLIANNNVYINDVETGIENGWANINLYITGKNISIDRAWVGGIFNAKATENININNSYTASELALTAGKDVTHTGDTVNGGMNINAGRNATFENIDSSRRIAITANKDVNLNGYVSSNNRIYIEGENILHPVSYPGDYYYRTINAAKDVTLKAKNKLNIEEINAGMRDRGNVGLSGKDINVNIVNSNGEINATSSGKLNIQETTAGGSIKLLANDDINVDNINSGELLNISSGKNVTSTGTLWGNSVSIKGNGNITTGPVNSNTDITLTAGKNANFSEELNAGRDINVKANNIGALGSDSSWDWTLPTIKSGVLISLTANNDVYVGNISGQSIALKGNKITTTGNVFAQNNLSAVARDSINMNDITATNVDLTAQNAINIQAISAMQNLKATSNQGSIFIDSIFRAPNKILKAAKGVHINYDNSGW